MKRLLLTYFIVGSLFSLSPAYSQGWERGQGGGKEGQMQGAQGIKAIMQELNLSDSQRDQLKALRESKPDRKSMRDENKEFLSLIFSEDATETSLRAKFEEIQKQKAEMSKVRFEHMLSMRSILTPEQRIKFKTLMAEKIKDRMGKGRR